MTNISKRGTILLSITKKDGVTMKKKKINKGIANEILIKIGNNVLLVFIAIAIVATFITYSIVMSSKETELTLESESASYQLADFFDQYGQITEQMAVNPQIRELLKEVTANDIISQANGWPTVFENLKNITAMDTENIQATWVGEIDSSVLAQSDGFISEKGWDITSRPWFACTKTGTTLLTEPYIDASTGNLIITIASPIYDNEKQNVLGVAGIDISLNKLNTMMASYKIGEKGYVMLLSSDGIFIYHPQEDVIQKNIHDMDISENVITAAENKAASFLKYKAGKETKYGFASPIGSTGYMVISCLPSSEYYSLLVEAVIALAVIFIIGIIFNILRMKKTAAKIVKPILVLNDAANELAAGNLNIQIDISANNEIGTLAQSIGKTTKRLNTYIAYIDEISEVLSQMADGKLDIQLQYDYVGEFQKVKNALVNISDSMNEVMENINTSADQVSAGADDLATASQGLAEGASAQASAVQELLATTTTVSKQVEDNKKDAEDSSSQMAELTKVMEHNKSVMSQMMNAMTNIQEASQKVVGIIQTIEEIADQTNLLSLNASIEAARAGEIGKGFAVVASEIGKLASESSQAVNTTRDLIGVSLTEIKNGNTLAEEVTSSLQAAVEAVERVNKTIMGTTKNAILQAENMEQIRQGIDEISQGIQDNSAMAEESSATSEELAAQATTLNEMIQKFELKN